MKIKLVSGEETGINAAGTTFKIGAYTTIEGVGDRRVDYCQIAAIEVIERGGPPAIFRLAPRFPNTQEALIALREGFDVTEITRELQSVPEVILHALLDELKAATLVDGFSNWRRDSSYQVCQLDEIRQISGTFGGIFLVLGDAEDDRDNEKVIYAGCTYDFTNLEEDISRSFRLNRWRPTRVATKLFGAFPAQRLREVWPRVLGLAQEEIVRLNPALRQMPSGSRG
jgi:hypothetical protein